MLSAIGEDDEHKRTVFGYLLGQSYIKALPTMAQDGERVFVPSNTIQRAGFDPVLLSDMASRGLPQLAVAGLQGVSD